MYFFAGIRKKRAIKSYINRLGKDLAKRYGRSKQYTPGQVVKTVQDCGYNWRHICYAHALYVSQKHFEKWHKEQGEPCDYTAMREDIAHNYFGGNVESMASSDFSGGFDTGFSDGSAGSD
ncbi:DUF6559 family protein [Pleionea sediminis]|uniref:DUF6559 family protein n=1 Tax=Pleionea sediminis TaxID=2569479 RepID=UPI0011860F31|nr:DUF6559 family protein [Pleionea sediminis]